MRDDSVLAQQHEPVGANIDIPRLRISGDTRSCADIGPTVSLMPLGPRKTGKVDVGPMQNIFLDRSFLRFTRLHWHEFFKFFFPVEPRFRISEIIGNSEHEPLSGSVRQEIS